MMKKGLVDLTKVFQNPKLLSSPFVDTTREVSINEGEPSASVSSILLTTPIAINQSYISPNRILPRHIFPPLHDITEGKITQLSHGYRNQLFSRSTTSTPEILRWYDLNFLLSLQEKVDESVLKQLIDILRLEGFGNVTSNRAKLLIGTLKAYLNFDEQ